MKFLSKLASFILFFSLPFCTSAQESKGVSESINGYPFNYPMKFSNGEYVFASGKYEERSDLNLVKFNSNLQVLWRKSLPDGVISIAKWNDNIIVFSSSEWKKNAYLNIETIQATLIDVKTGNTILNKDIVKTDGKVFIDPVVLEDSLNNFKGLLVRFSNLEHIKIFHQEKSFEQMAETQKIDWISLDDRMNVKSTITLKHNFGAAKFLSAISDTQGDAFITTTDGNKLTADKYATGEADMVATLSVALPKFLNDDIAIYNYRISPDEKSEIFSICSRTPEKSIAAITVKFDFSQNRALSFSADPKVMMGLEKSKGTFELFDQSGFAHYNDNLITIQQHISTTSYARGNESYSVFNSGDLLLSFFDEKMQAIKQITISANFPTYTNMGKKPGYKVIGNKMIILADVFDGSKLVLKPKYKLKYVIVNLDKMEIIKDTMLDVNNKLNSIVDAAATVWIGNTALIVHLIDTNAFSSKDFSMKLEKLEFNF